MAKSTAPGIGTSAAGTTRPVAPGEALADRGSFALGAFSIWPYAWLGDATAQAYRQAWQSWAAIIDGALRAPSAPLRAGVAESERGPVQRDGPARGEAVHGESSGGKIARGAPPERPPSERAPSECTLAGDEERGSPQQIERDPMTRDATREAETRDATTRNATTRGPMMREHGAMPQPGAFVDGRRSSGQPHAGGIASGVSTAVDRMFHAALGQMTLGLSPAAFWLAYSDWAIHLLAAPGKRQQLALDAVRKAARLSAHMARLAVDPAQPPCIEPLVQDDRFRDPAWQKLPFSLYYQSFLLTQQWWHLATTGVRGVSPHHEAVMAFVTRQMLDMVSPVNFLATNPEVLGLTWSEGGQNLVRGAANLVADWERAVGGRPPVGADAFAPGETVAVTPGAVVFRNRLIELIQYAPTTPKVHAEPVLIVPAWIMKYYILDLSPANSLVKHLVDNGHTVFMVSWHNPTEVDRDVGLDDYLRLGVIEALKVIRAIAPDTKVDAMGYCLGGTLLAIAAAYLAREQHDWLNTVTLLAAQTDFTEAGELMLFIDDSQLSYLEDMMWSQGYLDTRQMAGAFQLLRSNDLIWSRIVNEYLKGRRPPMSDLMAWNADATRMPYRMHSEYLARLFLANDLFEGRFNVDDRPVFLGDIRVPLFAVATERDHVAPWRSVYKINFVDEADVTFLLTSGGHNAGIVSEPGHKGRRYRMAHHGDGQPTIDPVTWFATTPPVDGSWWPAWLGWLGQHSKGMVPPPSTGARSFPALYAAPGAYVHER